MIMEKYLVKIDPDDINDIEVEIDDPSYDGCECSMSDPLGWYHITAETEEEAVQAARWLDSIGNAMHVVDDDDY
jgi:hypothetical protein